MYRILLIFVLALVVVCGYEMSAQSSETQSEQAQPGPPRVATPPIQIAVSGCLKRGPEGGYYISDKNGITWQLSSTVVDLSEHVMHAVTVTGKPAGLTQPPLPPSNQSGRAESGGSSKHVLQVRTLKMLSNSCTR
jgi:hypothetical protein